MTAVDGPRVRRALLVGAVAGIGAGLVFAMLHALIIVPIWDRMTMGLAFGAAAGAVGGWAYLELMPGSGVAAHRVGLNAGARFGALLWIAVVPVTAADMLLRATGIAPRFELLAVAIALVLAIWGGAVLGWYRVRSRRGVFAGAMATLFLTLAMGGPVPVGNTLRSLGIFLAVFPASVTAGAILGGALAFVERRAHR